MLEITSKQCAAMVKTGIEGRFRSSHIGARGIQAEPNGVICGFGKFFRT